MTRDLYKPMSYRDMALEEAELDRQADPIAQQGIESATRFACPQWSLDLKKVDPKVAGSRRKIET